MKELRKDRHISWITVPDMPRSDSAPSSLPKDETNDPFTNLFVFYAGKALEFPEPVFTSGSKPYCEGSDVWWADETSELVFFVISASYIDC